MCQPPRQPPPPPHPPPPRQPPPPPHPPPPRQPPPPPHPPPGAAAAAAPPAAASAAAASPRETELANASLWFYLDDSGQLQGPFPAATLRGWLVGGWFQATTRVAPSFYGEVPADDEFEPVASLWTDPAAAAFVTAEGVAPEPAAAAEGGGVGPDRAAAAPKARPSPYDKGGGRGGAAAGRGGKGGKGGKGDSGGGKGGGKGGKGGKGFVPPHLLRYQAFASIGKGGFMGGGAMGHHEYGAPKHNAKGPK